MRKAPYPAPKAPPERVLPDLRLSNDELAKAISVTLERIGQYHIKYNSEILKATEKHYIALITEELRRARVENPL